MCQVLIQRCLFIVAFVKYQNIKNNTTKFLTLSKLLANFDFTIVNASLFREHYFAYGGCYKYHIITVLNNYHMF